jgi:hypothetical protein
MSRILDLDSYRDKVVEERAFGPWQKRFNESYHTATRAADLSDTTLYFLATPGEESAAAFYELIMGALDLGKGTKFYYLGEDDQLAVVDRHLFMADQVRLDLMRRLEWLTAFPGESLSLFQMVKDYETAKAETRENSATLAPSHPELAEYEKLSIADRQVFLRRRLLKALEAFRLQIAD